MDCAPSKGVKLNILFGDRGMSSVHEHLILPIRAAHVWDSEGHLSISSLKKYGFCVTWN